MGIFRNLIQKLNPIQPYISAKETYVGPIANFDIRKAYNDIEIVSRCVSMIINACIDIPYDVVSNSKRQQNQLDTLLNVRPNPFEDRIRLFRRSLLDFLLDGNAFFYYSKDEDKLYILPALDVEIITDAKTFVAEYRYVTFSGSYYTPKETISFRPDEVIHIKDDNPESLYRGRSRLKAATDLVELYYTLIRFQRQFFDNNAIPGLVLKTEHALSKKVKSSILEHLLASTNTLYGRSRSPIILDNGLEVDKITDINFQSLDFESSIERLQQDIAKALGVPYVLLKSGNNANIAANQVLFYEHTVIPIMQLYASAFQQYFVGSKITPDKSSVNALQPDLNTKVRYVAGIVNTGLITGNEGRDELGFPASDDPEMDKIRIPRNITGSATNPSLGGRPSSNDTLDGEDNA